MLVVKRFAVFLLTVVAPLSLAAQPPLQRYAHRTCGYSFQYVAGWRVTPGDDERRPCEVRVVPPEQDAPSVWIDAGGGGVEDALQWTGFVRVDESVKAWAKKPDLPDGVIVAFGRKGVWRRTTKIEVGDLHGLRAHNVALECEGEPEGGRLCDRDIAFLTNGRQWVSVDGYTNSEAFELALKSFSIEPPPLCVYKHPRCGYSFKYLAGWIVVEDEDVCSVLVQPQDIEKRLEDYDVDIDTIRVKGGEGGFEEAAEEAGILRATEEVASSYGAPYLAGAYVVFGRSGWSQGEPIESGELHGLCANHVLVGSYHRHGGYAGLGGMSFAFLTNERRWVVIKGNASRNDTFDIVLESLAIGVPP